MSPETRLLSGWGRTSPTLANVERPQSAEEIALAFKALAEGLPARCIPRGLGRSYGDAAQSAGGTVLDMRAFDRIGEIDPVSRTVTVGGGASVSRLLAQCVPKGWFLPVTPGTARVTVGGAVAADVHGKNHHIDGAFAHHTAALTLVTPSGGRNVNPQSDPDLFWATFGGMGLTGAVVEATLTLLPIQTSYMEVTTTRWPDLSSVMERMRDTDAAHHYSVAWVDSMATGKSLGRAVLTQGDHAPTSDLPKHLRDHPLRPLPGARVQVPVQAPRGALNRMAVRLFNAAWFWRAPRQDTTFEPLSSYFYPLDVVDRWNLLYGSLGFIQYQFCVPTSKADVVARSIELLRSRGIPSFLSVLKRFGPSSPGPLSFPIPGWTLATDLPLGPAALGPTLSEIDDIVVEAGGRVYLAKDARLSAQHLAAMYPELAEFRAIQHRVDPDGLLGSDQSRRLGITAWSP